MNQNRNKKERILLTIGIVFILIASSVVAFQINNILQGDSSVVDFDYRQSALVGERLSFKNTSEINDDGNNWQWNFGDNTLILKEKNGSHIYTESGTYTVTLTYTGDTPNNKKHLIVINNQLPVASFEMSSDVVEVGEKVVFTNNSVNAKELAWSFDQSGSTSDEINPSFRYDRPGIYEVKLLVVNAIGQIDEDVKNITVIDGSRENIVKEATTKHVAIFNESTLEEILNLLANRETSRQDKKNLKNQIIQDVESITIMVDNITLENYLNKIQLEASSSRVVIVVDKIIRNSNNKISEIRLKK